MSQIDVIVAGHLCLDIIPTFGQERTGVEHLLAPGRLVHVGPAQIATGGAVSNTGLALHRLGVTTRLMGKVGADLFGQAILEVIRRRDPRLAETMIVDETVPSSYTIVINPPGVDRSFLHCPGANDTFSSADVQSEQLVGARIFHFGYPPLMRQMYADGGVELSTLLRRARNAGLITSLDMAHVDSQSAAGQVDWRAWLHECLPTVDLFLPNLEEAFFILDRKRFQATVERAGDAGLLAAVDGALLGELADQLLTLGAAVVGLKLGEQGLYLRTTSNPARLASLGLEPVWLGRELLAPAFQVQVVGTTGAGDCAIAGFLAALLRGLPPEASLTAATAAGACNVEQADAISGMMSWDAMWQRVQAGWPQRPVGLSLPDWQWDASAGLWRGPRDGRKEGQGV
ncbi:PfkB family carbohydrate kinase [Litorilinea aerophila]|uniref:Carbohydrate kinase family protein n=1 Tax=Litorilinea aerophila TaxID=1204385 RepID=A0A540VEU2_9CHLR|nr:PfkB family carbohydrate kinase [Litorilinea aerophila]MCC9077032.1 PfkB family carbohydrate kinase [Litorilinea aerophila]OUC06384.1 carbohydrate kinase [Litorilinea aerophila]